MDAKKDFLLTFLSKRIQLHIPLYQRNYSWTKKECQTLLDDIINIGRSDKKDSHFLGALVYLKEYEPSISPIERLTLIDGQQRITTIMLLISAIASYIKKHDETDYRNPDYLSSYYLINEREEEYKYKLVLSDFDNNTMHKIIDKIGFNEDIRWEEKDSQRLKDNFNYFSKTINESNIENIYDGLSKLIIILIALEPNLDNPQLIFESLNSTGKELNKSDLIRNYLLMGLDYEQQKLLYTNYWSKIEEGFRKSTDKEFDNFIKYYLTIKFEGKIPTDKVLYSSFKKYASTVNNKEELLQDMYKYAKYLFNIINLEENDKDLLAKFNDFKILKINSVNSFLINVYDDYYNNRIDKIDFLEILIILESFIVRRDVSGFANNHYNLLFGKLYWEMNKNDYMYSFKETLLLNKTASRKFPTDDEIKETIKNIDIKKDKHFILSKIENHLNSKILDLSDYEVEYILPNKSDLNEKWIAMLGKNYREIQKNYANTLGNLTLLPKGFKKESFKIKCYHENGYFNSNLCLNESILNSDYWNNETIIKRTNFLSEQLIKIWPYPKIDLTSKRNNVTNNKTSIIEEKKTTKKHRKVIKTTKYLKKNTTNNSILNNLSQKIFALNNSIEQAIESDYVLFTIQDNQIVKMIPEKEFMRILLPVPINKLNDPQNKCKDISYLDNPDENTEIIVDNINEINYVYSIIKQGYDYMLY